MTVVTAAKVGVVSTASVFVSLVTDIISLISDVIFPVVNVIPSVSDNHLASDAVKDDFRVGNGDFTLGYYRCRH